MCGDGCELHRTCLVYHGPKLGSAAYNPPWSEHAMERKAPFLWSEWRKTGRDKQVRLKVPSLDLLILGLPCSQECGRVRDIRLSILYGLFKAI